MMRYFMTAILAAAATGVAAANAADLPTTAPVYKAPPVVPQYNWTGFYVGINGGGAWGKSDFAYVGGPDLGSQSSDGGLIGGTIGFNYQTGPWVLGIEADWDWASLKSSTSCPNPAFSCDTKLDSVGTVRGRVGYAWNQILLYGTGGWAWTTSRVETVNLNGIAIPQSGSPTNGTDSTISGWTVGAGIEYAFWNNWSIKAEYLYVDFGTHRYTVDNGFPVDANWRENIFRVGLNYRFNWM